MWYSYILQRGPPSSPDKAGLLAYVRPALELATLLRVMLLKSNKAGDFGVADARFGLESSVSFIIKRFFLSLFFFFLCFAVLGIEARD
jgi:hypothetical protein